MVESRFTRIDRLFVGHANGRSQNAHHSCYGRSHPITHTAATNGLMSGASEWRGQLPAAQDYIIRALGTDRPAD
jgi:hypothetical protein